MADRPEREVEGLGYRLRDNQHPNTNGSPWGEIQDGQGRRVAVYSGWSGKERAQELLDALRTLTAERDRLEAEVERLRADAERLDWMEASKADAVVAFGISEPGDSWEVDFNGGTVRRFELRRAIDAARALEPETEE